MAGTADIDTGRAPQRVRLAVWSLYVITIAPWLRGPGSLSTLPPAIVATVLAIPAGEILLVEMIRRRRNWARFVYAAALVANCLSYVGKPRYSIFGGACLILNVVATAMLFGGTAAQWFHSPDDNARADRAPTASLWEIPVAGVNIVLIVATVVALPAVSQLSMLLVYVYFASPGTDKVNNISVGFAAGIAYLILLVVALIKWTRARYSRRTSATTLAWALAPLVPFLAFLLFVRSADTGVCVQNPIVCVQHPAPQARP
jgi:hypothetical protein